MWLKPIAKRLIGPLPQWASVGIVPTQQAISVRLESTNRSLDVTKNHTIASLRPLTVAIGMHDDINDLEAASLVYRDNRTGRSIGFLRIRFLKIQAVGPTTLGLFEVDGANHHCLSWPRKHWNTLLQERAIRRNRNPHNFQMTPLAVQQLMTFYICPRPVVLVSVSESTHRNIFPMDLIGPLWPECFTLALRNTSLSVPTMAAARRVAISGIGADHKDAVYRLGEHHKKEFTDWNALPFVMHLSETFRIPAVSSALSIRELAIEHNELIGSHMFFVCRIVSDRKQSSGLQLHHTAGFHQEFRRRRGDPFPSA